MKKKSGIKGKCVGEYSDDEIRIELCCYLWLADGNDPDNKEFDILEFRLSVLISTLTNWNLAGRQSLSLRTSDRRLLPWQSPSNSRTRNVIHRRGAHLERPAEKFLIFRFLSAKRFLFRIILRNWKIFAGAQDERPYEV